MRHFKVLANLVLLLSLCAQLTACEQSGSDSPGSQRTMGLDAHGFSLESRKKGVLDFGSLKGKPIILNFWATWCPPCVDEMPSFLSFSDWAKKTAGVETIAVSVDETWDQVDRFFGEKKLWSRGALPFTILLDPKGSVALSYGSTRYPETYFIDKYFKIIRKFIGPQDWGSQEIMRWVTEHSK